MPPQERGNALDEISKVLDFADKIRGRESHGNFAPGQSSQSSMSVGGMFQTRPQEQLAQQEMMLRNPAMMQQAQQQQTQQQQAEPGSLTLSAAQSQQMQQAVNTMLQGAQKQQQLINETWAFASQIMNCYNALAEYTKELEKVAALGTVANTYANAYLDQMSAAQDVVNVQAQMLQDPVYLLHHSFQNWDQNIGIDKTAMDYISQLFLELVDRFDARYQQATGQPSVPQQQQFQPQQYQQPQQMQQQPDPTEFVKQFSQAMTQGVPTVGKNLQRAHNQRLRM